ncbi:Gfo/Idh/MocA family protein [Anaerotalea alkaliphila]|uniref:Gfo/Idh/MocA family oxidoreductase n=1 Tax=Anaerotalea alkaliphila TaxID=2662126 RepID=A0A7X5KP21_9FIRM|nr:Gfo/Idh/MocA family oxidoreductase [Anaerotalea alkaliphila]NDL67397.1 Gfo/Idh/MocA family oxidoreductase [Anaerotalea alkaliphila]
MEKNRKLRVGIIGCGGIGTNKHMPSLAKIEEVEMTAFCDLDLEKADKAARDFGTANAGVYTDYREMLEKEGLEVVHVCTPNSSHAPISIAAMEAGCHVMCEKPMAKTTAEAKSMVEAAERTGRKLTIGYQNRFRTDSMFLQQACRRGDLGEVYFAKAHAIRRRAVPTWGVFLDAEAQGGGPLIDIGTHALDLTLWCMDNYAPARVTGSVYRKLGDQKDTGNAWGDWDPAEYTVEDSAFAFITMQDGATIVLESSWALNTLETGEAKTTLCGTKAGADMKEGLRINGADFGKLYVKKPNLDAAGVDFYEGDEEKPADVEARSWIDCILNDTEPVVKPEEALKVTEILEAVYLSAATGKTIEFN